MARLRGVSPQLQRSLRRFGTTASRFAGSKGSKLKSKGGQTKPVPYGHISLALDEKTSGFKVPITRRKMERSASAAKNSDPQVDN